MRQKDLNELSVHFKYKDTERLDVNKWRKVTHGRAAVWILDKTDFITLRNSSASPQNVKHRVMLRPRDSTPGYIPKRRENKFTEVPKVPSGILGTSSLSGCRTGSRARLRGPRLPLGPGDALQPEFTSQVS